MKPVMVPIQDVNSKTCTIVNWHATNRSWITLGDVLADVETSKAAIEVVAPDSGVLLHAVPQGSEISLTAPIAILFPDQSSLAAFEKEEAERKRAKESTKKPYRATVKAEELAAQYGIDLAPLNKGKLITQKDVKVANRLNFQRDYVNMPAPLNSPDGVERILLIGGGLGVTQVIDILKDNHSKEPVAILDDDHSLWGKYFYGIPVVGDSTRLEALYQEHAFSSIIITISTSIQARTKFRELCASLNIPLTNAIDKSAKLAKDVKIGLGNVICAFCHFGTGTVIGDNNFISAYNSFDHHSVIGSDISTGPGCIASGIVKIGNRVRMGAGIFIEPYLELEDDVQVASGAIILKSVPARHVVKRKVFTTVVVPIRNHRTLV
jgi:acetyltransferase-like isoleucine patch superfamily enzyme